MLIIQLQVQYLQLISDKILWLLPVSEHNLTVERRILIILHHRTIYMHEANEFSERNIVSNTHR